MYVNLEPKPLDEKRVNILRRHISSTALLGENLFTIRRPLEHKQGVKSIIEDTKSILAYQQPGNIFQWRKLSQPALGLTVLSETDTERVDLEGVLVFDIWNEILKNVPDLQQNVRLPSYDIRLVTYPDNSRGVNIVFDEKLSQRLKDQRAEVGEVLYSLGQKRSSLAPKVPHVTLASVDEAIPSHKAIKYTYQLESVFNSLLESDPGQLKLSRAAFMAGMRSDRHHYQKNVDSA